MHLPFLKHPLANVWRAVQQSNALRLALVQEANSVHVNDVDFVQIQSHRLYDLIDFCAQRGDVRTTKLTGQTNSSPVIPTQPIDSQRHSPHTRTCEMQEQDHLERYWR
jgi:hypothetical protein